MQERLSRLDRLSRNDFTLNLFARQDHDGYRVTFVTPSGASKFDCLNYGSAKRKFAELAEEYDMVSLDI